MPLTALERMRASLAAHPVRREVVFGLCAWLVFLAITVIYTWPTGIHLGSMIFGYPGDSTGSIALLAYRADLGVSPLSSALTTLENYPFGLDLPGASALPQIAVDGPTQVVATITGQSTLAYNLGIFAGLTLTPLGAYALIRYLVGSFGVALIAGLAFGFNPWHLERASGHLTLTNLQWIPVLILGLLLIRRAGSLHSWLPWAVFAGGLILTAYTNTYFALAIGVIVAAYVIADIGAAAVARARRELTRAVTRSAIIVGATIVAYVPQAVWFAMNRSAVDGDLAGTRVESDLYTYGARWWEWLVPSYRHPLFADSTTSFLTPRLHNSNFVESSLYLGWTVLALAMIGGVVVIVLRAWREHVGFPALLASLLVVLGIITASPKTVDVLGLSIPMPSAFIWPLFDLWRVYSRLWVVVMLGTVMLAAIGLAWLWTYLRSLTWRAVATAIVGALVLADLAVGSLTTFSTRPPPVYEALAKKSPGGRIEYPLELPAHPAHYQYILYTQGPQHPLVNGGKRATWQGSLQQRLRNPQDPWVAPVLSALGAPWMIVHDAPYTASGMPPLAAIPGAEQVWEGSGDRLFRITATTPQLFAFPGAGFDMAEPAGPRRYDQWMLGTQGSLVVINRTRRTARATLSFNISSFFRGRTVTIKQGPRVLWRGTVLGAPQRVRLRVAARPGRTVLPITATGPADSLAERLGVPDGRVVSLRISGIATSSPGTGTFTVG